MHLKGIVILPPSPGPFPASCYPLQIKTMTVKSVNHQMYDNHFPQAHYCSAHGRRTGSIIMPLPSPPLLLHQLWWFSHFFKGEAYSLGCLDRCPMWIPNLYTRVCHGNAASIFGFIGKRKLSQFFHPKTENYGCNGCCSRRRHLSS